MDKQLRERLFVQAKRWIYEAGTMIRRKMQETIIIETKDNPKDLVTQVDKKIELFLTDEIKAAYPEHFIISEEGYGDDAFNEHGTVWLIDPIDGTMNFIHQKRSFAISIGIYHRGIGEIALIYDVMAHVLYSAQRGRGAYKNGERLPSLNNNVPLHESVISLNHRWLMENEQYDRKTIESMLQAVRGVRTFGSAALEFAYVAEGAIDAYIKKSLEPWDIAAGIILVNEVGGKTSTLAGESVNTFRRSSIVTSKQSIHEPIIHQYMKQAKK